MRRDDTRSDWLWSVILVLLAAACVVLATLRVREMHTARPTDAVPAQR